MRVLRIRAGTLVRNITIELAPPSASEKGSDSVSRQMPSGGRSLVNNEHPLVLQLIAGWHNKVMIRMKKAKVISKFFIINFDTSKTIISRNVISPSFMS
jgi:hypothetical protein